MRQLLDDCGRGTTKEERGFPQLHCANAQCWVAGQNSSQRCLFDVLWCPMCQLLDDCGGGTSKEGGRAPPTV